MRPSVFDGRENAVSALKRLVSLLNLCHYSNRDTKDATPMTIYAALKARLGRTPTSAELRADVDRIKTTALVELATKGKLRHQRRR